MLRHVAMLPAAQPTPRSEALGVAAHPSARTPSKAISGFVRALRSHALLAVADQCIVSGMAFLVMVALGRWTDLGQLGMYAAAAAVLALALAVHDAVIARPYAIELHRPAGSKAEHAGATLLLSVALAAVIMLVLGAAALVMWALGASEIAVGLTLALALAAPFAIGRDFARRHAFADGRVGHAFILDGFVATLSIGGLVYVTWSGSLGAVAALLVQTGACALGALGWFAVTRRDFAFRAPRIREVAVRSWKTGKWLLSNHVALQVQGYSNHWLSLVLLGSASTGLFAACSSTVALINPVVFGFLNLIIPKASRSFVGQGLAGLRRQAGRDAAVLGFLTGVFCIVLFLFGDEITRALFRTSGSHSLLVSLLGVTSLVGVLGAPASVALTSAGRPGMVATITASVTVFQLGLTLALLPGLALVGAAIAALTAEVIATSWRWYALATLQDAEDRTGRQGGINEH
jgi:O-antigen/teichoic acid export membrane protein